MRDYSIFDQLSDEEFEGVKAAVQIFLDSDERGMFGFIPANSIVGVSTNFVATMLEEMVNSGMMACVGHKYANKEEKKEEGK